MARIDEPRALDIASYLTQVLATKGYKFFDRERRPFNLNIIGVRVSTKNPDAFDDLILVVYRNEDEGNPFVVDCYPITTEPGPRYLRKPIRSVAHKGTAILAPGQYRGAYRRGLHAGSYAALCQLDGGKPGEVVVYRDNDRDDEIDLDEKSRESGHFDINIHKHRGDGAWENVGAASAGCQVFKDTDDFDRFMATVGKAVDRFSNSFTYTLLTIEDVPKLLELFSPSDQLP